MRKINNLDSKWKGSGTSLALSASYSSPLNVPPIKLSLQHRSRFLRRVEITLHPVNGQLCPLFSFKPSPAITPNLSWEGNHSKKPCCDDSTDLTDFELEHDLENHLRFSFSFSFPFPRFFGLYLGARTAFDSYRLVQADGTTWAARS